MFRWFILFRLRIHIFFSRETKKGGINITRRICIATERSVFRWRACFAMRFISDPRLKMNSHHLARIFHYRVDYTPVKWTQQFIEIRLCSPLSRYWKSIEMAGLECSRRKLWYCTSRAESSGQAHLPRQQPAAVTLFPSLSLFRFLSRDEIPLLHRFRRAPTR